MKRRHKIQHYFLWLVPLKGASIGFSMQNRIKLNGKNKKNFINIQRLDDKNEQKRAQLLYNIEAF